MLRFPGHSSCAGQEFSLCGYRLPGSQHQKGHLLRGSGPCPPRPCAPTSRSCKVHFRGKPSEFLRGILSQSQLLQKVVLIQDLALSQLKSPTKSLSPSMCREPPGTAVPCSAGVTVLLCSKGDPLCAYTDPQLTHFPAS